MVWCVRYSSLETVDWSFYKFGSEGAKLTMIKQSNHTSLIGLSNSISDLP